MSVSGLLVTLRRSLAGQADADHIETIATIGEDPRFSIGPGTPVGNQAYAVAVACDTPDPNADEDAIAWLREQPGVLTVDVVAVYLDEEPAP